MNVQNYGKLIEIFDYFQMIIAIVQLSTMKLYAKPENSPQAKNVQFLAILYKNLHYFKNTRRNGVESAPQAKILHIFRDSRRQKTEISEI